MIYEPREDSILLEKQVSKLAFGRVLDLGTGSGIQALAALGNHDAGEVIAVDIDDEAIIALNDLIKLRKLRKIKALRSNLFENADGKFNTIIFNPPYLPQDKNIEDKAIYGGKHGWELSEQFFNQVSQHLAADGRILFLFSSLTNRAKIEELINLNLLQFRLLGQQKFSFEELYVYEITKSDLLRRLEARQLEQIHYFAKGQRGMIYTAWLDQSKLVKTHFAAKKQIKAAIKIKRPDSKAQQSIEHEVHWLKIVNKQGIGPKLLFYEEDFLVYEFVEGLFILEWIKLQDRSSIILILKSILGQCLILDTLGINKEEMHHPLKHIIITKDNKPALIDFERTVETNKPKNVTQFIEFICRIEEELKAKGLKADKARLRELAKEYKDSGDQQIIKEAVNSFY